MLYATFRSNIPNHIINWRVSVWFNYMYISYWISGVTLSLFRFTCPILSWYLVIGYFVCWHFVVVDQHLTRFNLPEYPIPTSGWQNTTKKNIYRTPRTTLKTESNSSVPWGLAVPSSKAKEKQRIKPRTTHKMWLQCSQ